MPKVFAFACSIAHNATHLRKKNATQEDKECKKECTLVVHFLNGPNIPGTDEKCFAYCKSPSVCDLALFNLFMSSVFFTHALFKILLEK